MLLYYRGRNSAGIASGGSIVAPDRVIALRALQGRGLLVTALDVATSPRGMVTHASRLLQKDSSARLAALRSLASLVQAGVPLRRALETVTNRRSSKLIDEALRAVATRVEAGASLSSAMEDHPHEFSAVAIAIVKAGEAGGSLDSALETIARWEERDRALHRRILAALTYPAIVTVAAFGLLLFLVGQTIPSFATTFAQMHAHLPLVTRILIRVGAIVDAPSFWLSTTAAAVVLCIVTFALPSGTATSLAIDRLRFRMPLVGIVFSKAAAARLARTLGSLLRGGVNVISAIEICMGVVGPAHRECLTDVTASLRRGEGLAHPFEKSGIFEPAFVQLVRSGEESGTVDVMLLRVARFYEADVETSLVALTSTLEPFLICTLGLAVGTIVASIIIPLYTMIGNIQ